MDMISKFGLFFFINYLVGSIPFALVIGKLFFNKDVRLSGSGNLGATNAGRVLGKKAAWLVFAGDALKGFVLFIIEKSIDPAIALYGSLFSVLGHCYPVFANFKGGKAVSTTIGIFLGMAVNSMKDFIIIILVPVLIWLMLFYSFRYVSLASCCCVFSSALLQLLFIEQPTQKIISIILACIVILRHHENIVRLINGNESKTFLSKRK